MAYNKFYKKYNHIWEKQLSLALEINCHMHAVLCSATSTDFTFGSPFAFVTISCSFWFVLVLSLACPVSGLLPDCDHLVWIKILISLPSYILCVSWNLIVYYHSVCYPSLSLHVPHFCFFAFWPINWDVDVITLDRFCNTTCLLPLIRLMYLSLMNTPLVCIWFSNVKLNVKSSVCSLLCRCTLEAYSSAWRCLITSGNHTDKP